MDTEIRQVSPVDEYVALRNDNRSRLEYLNKLNSGFITFTTAVLTICLGLFVFIGNMSSHSVDLITNINNSSLADFKEIFEQKLVAINVCVITLRFFQAMLLLTPIIYSKICFNHTLENNIRMSLNSDYLENLDKNEHNLYRLRHKYNDNQAPGTMPESNQIFPYYFGFYGALVDSHRVGDLGNMHRIISLASLIVGGLFGITVFSDCVYSAAPESIKPMFAAAGFFFSVVLLLELLAHCIITVIVKRRASKKYKEDKDFDGRALRKWNFLITNIILILLFIGAIIICCIHIKHTTIVSCVSNIETELSSLQAKEAVIDLIIATVFVGFVTFTISQYPGYKLELIVADSKIKHNRKALRKQFRIDAPASKPTPVRTYTKGTNGLAIAGFICAFLFPFVGLVLSIVALSISKSGYEKPMTGLAIAGIIIGTILLVLRLCLAVLVGAMLSPLIRDLIERLLSYIGSVASAA